MRLTKNAAFRYKAYLEEIDYATNRGLDRNQMERLATLDFVRIGNLTAGYYTRIISKLLKYNKIRLPNGSLIL